MKPGTVHGIHNLLDAQPAGPLPGENTPTYVGNTITDNIAAADVVVVVGTQAHVDPVGDTPIETWDTDEPSQRGIDGPDRMRLIRDDIAARVNTLTDRLTTDHQTQPVTDLQISGGNTTRLRSRT